MCGYNYITWGGSYPIDQFYIVKYDTSGNILWTRTMGGTSGSSAVASGISTDAGGNVYVCGWAWVSLDGYTSAGSNDIFVCKYDSGGNRLWTRLAGTTTGDYARGVSVDGAGNVYVCGYTSGSLDGNTSTGGNDIFIIKYDSSGNKLWTRQAGTANGDSAEGIAVSAVSEVYICGYTAGGLDGNTNSGLDDFFTMKYDSDGNHIWTRQMGTASVTMRPVSP
jgi:hypothetical protein